MPRRKREGPSPEDVERLTRITGELREITARLVRGVTLVYGSWDALPEHLRPTGLTLSAEEVAEDEARATRETEEEAERRSAQAERLAVLFAGFPASEELLAKWRAEDPGLEEGVAERFAEPDVARPNRKRRAGDTGPGDQEP
jgi:hypothetical protein